MSASASASSATTTCTPRSTTPSFDAMLRVRGVFSPPQARKLIAVVRALDRAQAIALGSERAARWSPTPPRVDGARPRCSTAGTAWAASPWRRPLPPFSVPRRATPGRFPLPRPGREEAARVRGVELWLRAHGVSGVEVTHRRGAVLVALPLEVATRLGQHTPAAPPTGGLSARRKAPAVTRRRRDR